MTPSVPMAHERDHTIVEIVDQPWQFESLAAEWDDLLNDSDQCVFFLRHRWNCLWWQHFAPSGSQLHVIVCRNAVGALVGVAPFYWRTHRVLGMTVGRELMFLGAGVPTKSSEYLDVASRRGWELIVAKAVAECLRASRWDRVWLSQVPSASAMLPHLASAFGARVETKPCDRAPYVDTSMDWAAFKSRFGRSMRRNVEYYPRRLFRLYPTAHFAWVQSIDELEPAMDALVRLHRRRWLAVGEPGAFSQPFEAFLREAMRDAFRSSRLMLSTLTIGGNIEAALVGFLDNGVFHYFQKGFNPDYAKDELGNVIVALSIRTCIENPRIKRFDFMGGGAQYKTLWGREATESVVSVIARPTLGTALLNAHSKLDALVRGLYHRLVPQRLREARRDRLRRRRLAKALIATGLSEPLASLIVFLQ